MEIEGDIILRLAQLRVVSANRLERAADAVADYIKLSKIYLDQLKSSLATSDYGIVDYRTRDLDNYEVVTEIVIRPLIPHTVVIHCLKRDFDEEVEYQVLKAKRELRSFIQNYPIPKRLSEDRWVIPVAPHLYIQWSIERIMAKHIFTIMLPNTCSHIKEEVEAWLIENTDYSPEMSNLLVVANILHKVVVELPPNLIVTQNPY